MDDPFFSLMRDHSAGTYMQRGALSSYWESMQRQYGTLKNTPKRDDPSFARAMEFREREKEHYRILSHNNVQMQQQMQLASQSMENLTAENKRLYNLISSFQREQQQLPTTNEPLADSGCGSGPSVIDAPDKTVPEEGDGRDGRGDGCTDGGEDYSAPSTGDGVSEPAA